MAARRVNRPLVLLDLAVPRDIEPAARDCPGIALYDMDDLQQAVARNLGAREAEAAEARVLVRQEVERFERWLASLDVLPTISALRERGDEIVEQVLRENELALGVALAGRPRAARGDGPRRGQPPAPRADAAAQGQRRRGRLLPLRARAARAVRARRSTRTEPDEDSQGAEVTPLAPRRRSRSG